MSESHNIKKMVRHIDVGVIRMPNTPIQKPEVQTCPLTPLSPSSLYSKSPLVGAESSFINAVLFCHWDNILGPRILNVWMSEKELTDGVLKQVCSRCLSGEVCRDTQDSFVDFKFLDLPEMDLIVTGFVFVARGNSGLGVHSLSVVMPRSELTFYLLIHSQMSRCLEGIIARLRYFLHTSDDLHPSVEKEFTNMSRNCFQHLTALKDSSLASAIKLSETFLCPSHLLERDFLCRCIASHLMTFGHSLVIGEKVGRISLLISTLALFNTKEERQCSKQVRDGSTSYHHDLWVQGVVKKSKHSQGIPMDQVSNSRYPVSIINLTTRDVKQAYSYQHLHFYSTHGNESNEELTFLNMEQSETLVQVLMDELEKLPAECGVREAYISQFMTVLQRKAFTLIKYIEGETNFGMHMFRAGTRKLRHDLGITTDGDLNIMLAVAEKLKPGIIYFLYGDGQWTNRTMVEEY